MLSLALTPAEAIVPENVEPDAGERFRRLAEDVGRVGRALTRLSQAGIAGEQTPVWDALAGAAAEPAPLDPARIREVIRLRKLRSRFFEPSLFADPAWDIFLDLMAAQLEGAEVSVSSLCIASEVPPSTGLRWIGALTERGLLVRRADPDDRRRVHVELADSVAAAMTRYFAAIQAASPPVI